MPGHRPKTRLLLTLAALASLIVGYYLGQYWQRQPLQDLSAVVYPDGSKVNYPAELNLSTANDNAYWRLFISVDTGQPACENLLNHYTLVLNRLAAQPRIQQNLRLTALAFNQPSPETAELYRAQRDWLDVLSSEHKILDGLAQDLGIAPISDNWCEPMQANAILVAPDHRRWALIPHEQAAIMAHNIRTIIEFVE